MILYTKIQLFVILLTSYVEIMYGYFRVPILKNKIKRKQKWRFPNIFQ